MIFLFLIPSLARCSRPSLRRRSVRRDPATDDLYVVVYPLRSSRSDLPFRMTPRRGSDRGGEERNRRSNGREISRIPGRCQEIKDRPARVSDGFPATRLTFVVHVQLRGGGIFNGAEEVDEERWNQSYEDRRKSPPAAEPRTTAEFIHRRHYFLRRKASPAPRERRLRLWMVTATFLVGDCLNPISGGGAVRETPDLSIPRGPSPAKTDLSVEPP